MRQFSALRALSGCLALACAALAGAGISAGVPWLWIAAGAAALGAAAIVMAAWRIRRRWMAQVADILRSESVFEKYINSSSIATAILDEKGRICWQNPAFCALTGYCGSGRHIFHILPGFERPDVRKRLEIGGVQYERESTPIRLGRQQYTILRLTDPQRNIRTVDANRAMLPVFCIVQLDNRQSCIEDMTSEEAVSLDAALNRLIARMAEKQNGMYIRTDKDKYLVCFEHKHLHQLRVGKFSLLSEVRAIGPAGGQRPTVSMALGVGHDPRQSYLYATKALELCLGRGGDQAVLRDSSGYQFFGGVQQAAEVRSRVRSRTMSRALRNLMEQCEDVFIMGHTSPDLDCLGSALGLAACARAIGKQAYIVMEKPGPAVEPLFRALKSSESSDAILSPIRAHAMLSPLSMLIVVDTQTPGLVAAPSLLSETRNLAVIDHHIRGTEAIRDAALFYHEPYASSTAEMVTEMVQYFSENVRLFPAEAEALLAGIALDTKNFTFKTGVRTFEAASYLRRAGADTLAIRQLFQDDLETFSARSEIVRHAQVEDGIAMAAAPEGSRNPQLLAAQAADALLGIRGVAASFVLCPAEGDVHISARSLGSVNVQMILEKLGGGGHATMAGALLRDTDIAAAQAALQAEIHAYVDAHKE